MPNEIKVAMHQTIVTLARQGWSTRRIARELRINRRTVVRHLCLARQAADSKCTIPPTGSEAPKCTIPPAGSDGSAEGLTGAGSERSVAIPDSGAGGGGGGVPGPVVEAGSGSGRRSQCEPYREWIGAKLEVGLSAKRIHQDLVAESGFAGSYDSVKRLCRRLEQSRGLPPRRLECAPGEEVQVDFGRGAALLEPDGRRRYPHLFRIVLSCSRKAYSEVVPRQSTEYFIRAIENAFRHFGGVTRTIVTDNLRAAVKRADWFDPELNPKIVSFCEHYGTALLPARPRHPEGKGKVERAVDYAQENALKGRTFPTLQDQNRFLLHWEETVADTRIHGTTRRQVRAAFEQERPALLPLPPSLFPCFDEGRRSVHRDAHIEVDKAYYSVPVEYLRREVWARWDGRVVRVFNQRFEQIAVHARQPDGKFSTLSGHIPAEKISGLERGTEWMFRRAALMGTHCEQWARAMLANRGIYGLRVLQGLLSLAGRHPAGTIDTACRKALDAEAFRLRDLRRLFALTEEQPVLAFLDSHPLIRDLDQYGELVAGVAADLFPNGPDDSHRQV